MIPFKAIAVGALLALWTVSCPAAALTTGECAPAGIARQALAAEGQNPIIVGNRSGYGYPTALIFFSNADGSKGYAIRADKPLGEQAGTVCVDSVYRDIRLNDISRPGIPSWAKMGGDAAQIQAICRRDRLGYQEQCRGNDESLSNLASNDTRVMFMAVGSAINPRDKSVRQDQRLIVAASTVDQKGIVKAVTAEGASYMLSAYTHVAYTKSGEALLGRRD